MHGVGHLEKALREISKEEMNEEPPKTVFKLLASPGRAKLYREFWQLLVIVFVLGVTLGGFALLHYYVHGGWGQE